MDSQSQQQDGAGQATLNALGSVVSQLSEYGQNASNNLQKSFTDVSTTGWIRLIMIVCTYLLVRPHILKHSTKHAVKNLEQQDEKDKAAAKEAVAKMSPNDLRGLNAGVDIDDVDADEGADGSNADWGSKARVRQRKVLRKILEAEERRRYEEESDEDIRDLLE